MHIAIQFNQTPIVAYLVAKFGMVDAVDAQGMTPAMWAATKSHM